MPLDEENDYQTQSDADTLQKHAEIKGDPKRHKKALGALQDRADNTNDAIGHAKRSMRKKVKGGLKKAFPKDTPFEQAGASGGTPYDKAENGDNPMGKASK